MLVWRKLTQRLRNRIAVSMVLGFFFGAMGIAVADGMGLLVGAYEALFVFGLLGTGFAAPPAADDDDD